MATTKQIETNTYAAELSRNAYVSIHNEEALKDVNRCTELYKDNITTKEQLDTVYDNAMEQTKY